MRFALFVATRYLFSRRKQTFISIISLVSVLGVAIGVAALVVVMGVYNGFTTDIRDRILGSNAHVMLLSADPSVFDPPWRADALPGASPGEGEGGEDGVTPYLAEVRAMPGVRAATPYLLTEVLLSTPRGATGLVLRGVDPVRSAEALTLLRDLEEGRVEDLAPAEGQFAPGIIIGSQLAQRFGVGVGGRINLMSPAGQRSSAGFTPRIETFKVAGVFNSGMSDYDSRLAYVSLQASQELMGLPPGRISGIEVFVDDPYRAREVAAALEAKLGPPFYARNWMDMNASLFAALELERIGMFIVLALIILVASFSIITSLVMLVMEKTRDIAVMMSMGATSRTIRRIFTLQGIIIGAVGTTAGYAMGLGLAWLLKRYQFIELPPGVYALDRLPMLIDTGDTVVIGVASMLMCFLATIYPSRQAARLMPAQALRYE